MIKQKLLSSAIEIVDEKDYSQLNEEVKNAEKPKQAIYFIKKCLNVLDSVDLIFKIHLYKLLYKCTALQKSTPTSSYFKNNF